MVDGAGFANRYWNSLRHRLCLGSARRLTWSFGFNVDLRYDGALNSLRIDSYLIAEAMLECRRIRTWN